MREIKLVFTGSTGAGKTTAIQALSEIPVINTDVRATDEVKQQKATTTVALDYGEMRLDNGQKLRIYGTPGQNRFAYMWDILMHGALGLVILIDNSAATPLDDMERYLNHFRPHIEKSSAVIGVTMMDKVLEPELMAYNEKQSELGFELPIFSVDARDKDNVVVLVQALVAMLEFADE